MPWPDYGSVVASRVGLQALGWLQGGAALLAVLLLAGFGAGRPPLSRAQYQRQFDASLSRFDDYGVEVFTKPIPTTTAGKIREFGVIVRLVREAIADLDVGSPPADAKADNEAMLVEYRMTLRTYQRVIIDLQSENFAAAQRIIAANGASPKVAVYARAVKDLQAKGYKYHYIARRTP